MRKTILIVGGQLSDRTCVVSLLEFFGHVVLQADDGIEAMQIIDRRHPDLVISDVLMQACDGYELAAQIRASDVAGKTPVIFLVPACYASEALHGAADLEVEHVISKPERLDVIYQKVCSTLRIDVPADLPDQLAKLGNRRLVPLRDPIDPKSTVFIVDDDPMMLRLLCGLVSANGLIVQAFSRAEAFLSQYQDSAGCLLLDLSLEGSSGIEVLESLRSRRMQIPTIFLTGRPEIPAAQRAIRLGALDFLEKTVLPRTMLARVYFALQEDSLRRSRRNERDAVAKRMSGLTDRECEMLHHLIDGKASKQIAAELNLSVRTVANHRSNLMAKTGAVNVADLVRMSMIGRGST